MQNDDSHYVPPHAVKSDEPKAHEIKVTDFDELSKEMAALEIEIENEKAATALKTKKYNSMLTKAKLMLNELERDGFDSAFGEFEVKKHLQVKMPEDEGAKMELFDWLKKGGLFERYATVNAISLKSLVKAERAEALKRGEDMMTWTLPGVNIPTEYEEVKFKRNKEKDDEAGTTEDSGN